MAKETKNLGVPAPKKRRPRDPAHERAVNAVVGFSLGDLARFCDGLRAVDGDVAAYVHKHTANPETITAG